MVVQEEKAIANFFDAESRSMLNRHTENGLPESALLQVKDIIDTGVKSAIDVGSGPGSVLLEMLNQGIDVAVGVDLSSDMIKIAKERIEKKGYENRVTLIQGSFLDVDLETSEAVSLHRVLCCHPDREKMLEKSLSLSPKVITMTIPRDWKVLALASAVIGTIISKLGKFRPFIHSQKRIDKQLKNQGYNLVNRHKDLFWVTSTYYLNTE